MTLEERFAKVVGRPATEAERERLHRIREALDVQDNDALWSIVMALEVYDSLYREYPEKLAGETTKAIEGARLAFVAAAAAESAKARAELSKQVARTSAELAQKLARQPVAPSWVAAAGAAIVLFGALCVTAGAVLAGGQRPWWTTYAGGVRGILGGWLGAPAGWIAFVLLLPVAGRAARQGWELGRDDNGEWFDRALGWAMVATSVLGAVGCVVVLREVL